MLKTQTITITVNRIVLLLSTHTTGEVLLQLLSVVWHRGFHQPVGADVAVVINWLQ